MKGRIQILGLVGLSVLAVLIVGAPGAKPLPDIQLKATFEPLLQSTITGELIPCNMLNDIPSPYVSTSDKRYANVVKIAAPSTSGQFIMTINTNNSAGRFIWISFPFEGEPLVPDDPNGICAPSPLYFLADKVLTGPEANIFRFKTMWKYTESFDANGNRILENTMTPFNFAAMTKGSQGIVTTIFDFYVADDIGTLTYNEATDWFSLDYQYPARVFCDDFDGDGKLEWKMRPVQESFIDPNDFRYYFPLGTLIRGLKSNYYHFCKHAEFLFPFELTLDPK